jgi:D-tyrosyl-tRNA(Tyr) deacylase
MRALLQRVLQANVSVDGEIIGQIGPGLLVLLGTTWGDAEADLQYILEKTLNLRIFSDEHGKMNLSLLDTGGQLLVVSQFTLLAQTRKGRRPSFVKALAPEQANALYEQFIARAAAAGVAVASGRFGAHMAVSLTNDGPVTILLDSRDANS